MDLKDSANLQRFVLNARVFHSFGAIKGKARSPYVLRWQQGCTSGSQLPDYLSASLRKNSYVHSRNTRNCDVNLLCPLHRNISEGGRTFAARTVKDWNNLPRSLKTRRSLKSFKAELWKVVLNSQKSKGSFDLN